MTGEKKIALALLRRFVSDLTPDEQRKVARLLAGAFVELIESDKQRDVEIERLHAHINELEDAVARKRKRKRS